MRCRLSWPTDATTIHGSIGDTKHPDRTFLTDCSLCQDGLRDIHHPQGCLGIAEGISPPVGTPQKAWAYIAELNDGPSGVFGLPAGVLLYPSIRGRLAVLDRSSDGRSAAGLCNGRSRIATTPKRVNSRSKTSSWSTTRKAFPLQCVDRQCVGL